MTPYSQRDPRWKDIKINGTQYTIGTDGCLLTCLGMIADVPPDVVVKKIDFNGAQVAWTGLDRIGLALVDRDNTYDNTKVSGYIRDNGSCIVRVDWDGSPKTGGDTHFVLFIGNKRMIDPWTGNEVDTSKYPLLTGFRAVRRISMPDTGKVEVDSKTFEELVTKSSRYDEFQKIGYTSAAQVEQDLKDLKASITEKNSQIEVERQRAEGNRADFNNLLADVAKTLNTVQEINQVEAALQKAGTDLDTLDDLQRQFAALQVSSKEQVEELNAEIARLKALKSSIDDATIEELLGALIKRLLSIIRR